MKHDSLLSKLSLDKLKKNDQPKQCHFRDFQPLLEYSSWHLFQEIVAKLIKGCKSSLYLAHSIVKHHGLTREWEDSLPSLLSKTIGEQKKRKMPKVKALKEENDPLHDLFIHRKKYSIFTKE